MAANTEIEQRCFCNTTERSIMFFHENIAMNSHFCYINTP
jgi:hypothetical protein